MYRVSSHVIKNASILLRHCKPVELRVASLSRTPVSSQWYRKHRERDPCPPPPPPPLPPLKVPVYLIGTGLFLALTAGFLVYAKQNPEIRDWLSINAPWFDNIIAVVYEENDKLSVGIKEYLDYFKELVDKYLEELPEDCYPKSPKPPPPPVPVSDKPAIDDGECHLDDDEEDEEEEDEEPEPVCVIPPPPPAYTKDICKFEECLKDAGEDTVNNYLSLRDHCIYYNNLVLSAMSNFDADRIEALEGHTKERNEFFEQYEANAKAAYKTFNDMANFIACGVDAPKDRLNVTLTMAKDFRDLISRTKIEYTQQKQRTEVMEKQWRMVKCTLDKFIFEVSTMFPELDWRADHPKINGELDLYIIHTKKYVDILKEQMSDTTDYITGKMSRAYEAIPVPKGKEKEKEAKLQNATKQAKTQLEKEYADRVKALCKDFDDALKAKLRDRDAKADAVLTARLKLKEEELNDKAERMIREKVEREKTLLQAQLDAMEEHLRIVDKKLEARLKAEREAKRARLLHMASQSLLAATKKGDPRVNVEKELEILRKAGDDDPLVTTVLNAIPGEVRDLGVVPESVIKDDYLTMEDVAMKVSMVEREGGRLPLYAFSWIQSKFLFMKPISIPQAELDNPPKEPFENMDTFDLLQRARYFLGNGNLANAVRYVNAMEGASRGAAEAWYQSANALLQTRLAAEAITAHAAALTLQYI